MQEATRALGVTRQTVLQRVKRGEIQAAHVTKGGKVGLRLKLPDRHPTLFDPPEGAQSREKTSHEARNKATIG